MKSSILLYLGIVLVALSAVLLGYPQPKLDFERDILPLAKARMGIATTASTATPLDGLVVVITGATAGIGKSMTHALISMGATVVAIGRSKEKLDALKHNVNQDAGRLIPVVAELSDLESVSRASDAIQEQFHHIDVLINNAGMHYAWSTFHHPLTPQGYDLSFGVNYLSHFLLTERMVPLLRNSGRPSIVQVSSSFHLAVDGSDLLPQKDGSGPIASQKGATKLRLWRDQRAYSNAKLAQVLHMRSLQREYTDIHSVSVCPGWVGTNIAGGSHRLVYHILSSLAFPVDGFGLNSLLHAVLRTEYDDDEEHGKGDFLYNSRFVALAFSKCPKWMLSPRMYELGIRDAVMFALASVMLVAQKFTPEVHAYASSPESYSVELQDELFAWSRSAVAGFHS